MRIYLDHNATTPTHPLVKSKVQEWLESWGNPSSIHWSGRGPKQLIRESRQSLAQALGVSPLEIVFTSGASESNNTVLKSVLSQILVKRNEIIISNIEHPSILKTAEYLETQGLVIHKVDVDRNGNLNWQQYQERLSAKTALVSMMYANNETGLILDIKRAAEMAHSVGALIHSDITQAFGKIPVSLKELDVDFASASAHKIYALKGVGLLYIKKNREISNLIHGGGQERYRRGGTENTLGIASFGQMASVLPDILIEQKKIKSLRDYLESRVLTELSGVQINHQNSERLPNTSSMIIDEVDGETLLMSMDVAGFSVSTGAACSSGAPEPSPVLIGIGLSRKEAQSSLRISLGLSNSKSEIDAFIDSLKEIVTRLRAINTEHSYEVEHAST